MAIKPDTLWALCKATPPHTLGRVMATVGRQTVEPPLNEAEQALVKVVEQASLWMDEASEKARTEWRERQNAARQRARRKTPPVAGVTVTEGVSRDVTLIHPSIHPSVNDTLTKSNKLKTDSDSDSVPPGGQPNSESESESVLIQERIKATGKPGIDPWSMPADQILYGRLSAMTIMQCAFGRGPWAKVASEVDNDDAIKELFLTFRSELRAGEVPNNVAAAWTARLKKDLGVTFGK